MRKMQRLFFFTFFYLFLLFFLSVSVIAYGPFSLPIHDNDVKINGGAWWYSNSCTATTEHGGFDFDGENGDDSDDSDNSDDSDDEEDEPSPEKKPVKKTPIKGGPHAKK